MTENRFIFGPVPSRRLGRSLGVDLTPRKTCTYDCVYCQLGHTIHKTLRRSEYARTGDVIGELKQWLHRRETADYVTLSGSGEPTLHTRFGDVIREIKDLTDIPVALLTNGSLLSDPEVRREACAAHLVKVSFSAWNQRSFEAVHRPHPDLAFTRLLSGASAFRQEYTGQVWIEVFVVPGINSEPEQMRRIAEHVARIGADRVHLNTAVRPPAEEFVGIVPQDELSALATLFDPPAEVVADYSAPGSFGARATAQSIRRMLQRRPCTAAQISSVSGLHQGEVTKYLGGFLFRGEVRAVRRRKEVYYEAVGSNQGQKS